MKFTIGRLERTVELDDALVKKYCEYDELREQPFSIVIRTKFGHKPTPEEISDDDLSKLCNEILLSELKALAMLPAAVSMVDQLEEQTRKGELAEYNL